MPSLPSRTDTSVSLPASTGLVRSDGGGYLMFGSVGGVCQTCPDGLRRITTGYVLAAGPTGWLFAVSARGRLLAIDTRSGDTERLGVRRPAVRQVAVRSAS